MARIDQVEIDRIKRETDIVQLIQGYGTKLKDRNGEELIGLCPVHDDKNPSLCVNRKKNEWIKELGVLRKKIRSSLRRHGGHRQERLLSLVPSHDGNANA